MVGWLASATALLLLLGPAGDLAAQPPATDELIRHYQARLARRSAEPRSYVALGQAYILKARETGDPQYYDLASNALTRALDLAPDPATASRAATELAIVHMARHQFREALVAAQRALAYSSANLSAYGPLGDAYIEIGEYEQAGAAYDRMKSLQGPSYPHSRLSMLWYLKGDPPRAIAEMRRAIEESRLANQPRENIAWAQFKLGAMLFQTGDLAGAENAHLDSLTTYPNYHRAAAGLAQVRAAQGRYAEAIELYKKALTIIPLPDYAASLGDLYSRIGRPDEARKQYALVEYIGLLSAANKVLYNRELALFYLDHDLKLTEALDLARRELDVRPDIYSHDVLAWALYKNGRPADALASMRSALRLGTKDPRLFFHAGMIDRAAGDTKGARDNLSHALALNPHFHPLQAEIARQTLKELEAPTRQR